MTSIIIPTHKDSKTIWECVKAIVNNTNQYEIVFVVSEFSEFSNALSEFGKVKLVEGEFCFAKSVNVGIKESCENDIVVLNDDTIVRNDWLERLKSTSRQNRIVQARCQEGGCANVDSWGFKDEMRCKRTLNMFCVFIPRQVIEMVGLLDERFVKYGCEDDDYSLRCLRAGVELWISDCVVEHKKSQSFKQDRIDKELSESYEIFKNKWGTYPPVPHKEKWDHMKIKTPLISVIIATRNHEKFIGECIKSVLESTIKNFEVLIGIDGEDQGKTEEVVKTFMDERIRTFVFPHAGSCATRNKLIDKASGEFVAIMDSDDLMMPSRLTDQFLNIDSYTDVIHSNFHIELDGVRGEKDLTPINIPQMLRMKGFVAGGTFFARTNVLREFRFNPEYEEAFDFEFVLRTHKKVRFKHTKDRVIVYRRRNSGHLSATPAAIDKHKWLCDVYKERL